MRSRHLKEAQRWRDRADQMRSLASETDDPESRTIMLRLAINYDSLSKRAEATGRGLASPAYELTAIRTNWDGSASATK
jgi:hypothetical protein